jgi:hypothetical protein
MRQMKIYLIEDEFIGLFSQKKLFSTVKVAFQLGMVLANLGQIMYITHKRGPNMSETAFAELESQVEGLPYTQLEELQWKIGLLLMEKKSQKAHDISGLKKYLGNTDLDIDLDALRGRNDPR